MPRQMASGVDPASQPQTQNLHEDEWGARPNQWLLEKRKVGSTSNTDPPPVFPVTTWNYFFIVCVTRSLYRNPVGVLGSHDVWECAWEKVEVGFLFSFSLLFFFIFILLSLFGGRGCRVKVKAGWEGIPCPGEGLFLFFLWVGGVPSASDFFLIFYVFCFLFVCLFVFLCFVCFHFPPPPNGWIYLLALDWT